MNDPRTAVLPNAIVAHSVQVLASAMCRMPFIDASYIPNCSLLGFDCIDAPDFIPTGRTIRANAVPRPTRNVPCAEYTARA